MSGSQSLSLNRFLFAFLTVGFLFLLVETYLEHSPILGEEKPALIPILFSALATVVFALTTAAWRRFSLGVARGVCVLAIGVGLVGLYFHLEERLETHAAIVAPAMADPEERREPATDEEAGHEEPGEMKPAWLAPLAFVGMGVLGLAAASRRLPAENW